MESQVRYCGKPAEPEGKFRSISGAEFLEMLNNRKTPEFDNESDALSYEDEKREEKEISAKVLASLRGKFGEKNIFRVTVQWFYRWEDLCTVVKISHKLEKTGELRSETEKTVSEILYNGGEIFEDILCGYYDDIEREWVDSDSENYNGTWVDDDKTNIKFCFNRLNSLTGLSSAKARLRDIIDIAEGRDERDAHNNVIKNVFTFEGNPGCGKTMVAEYFADCLKATGVVTAEQPFHDVHIHELIGKYIGHTEAAIGKVFKDYADSVIFIDEAYSIGEVGKFGKNAINSIIKHISDMTENTVLIMAGYPGAMTEFLKVNPGLESRVSERILFDDYSLDELLKILEDNLWRYCKIKYGENDSDKIRKVFAETLRAVSFNSDENCGRSIGNARAVDNLIRKVEMKHTRDVNSKKIENPEVNIFELSLETAEKIRDEVSKQARETGSALGSVKPPYLASHAELEGNSFDKIIGNENAKAELIRQAEIMRKYGNKDNSPEDSSANVTNGILLAGYPGCGKTALARAFANEVAKDGSKVAFVVPDINTLITDTEAVGKLFNDIEIYDRCVLFLDEVDTVGTERTQLLPSSPRYTTLMTLLTKLDGFKKNGGLFVLSATNHPEVLDSAIRRRLGTEIKIELPNVEERVKIIEIYIGSKQHDISADELKKFGERLNGNSGAEIETVVRNALKTAGSNPLTAAILNEAINEFRLGHKSNALIPQEERERIAIHEMGHAVVQIMLDNQNKDVAVYLEHRTNGALGYTTVAPNCGNLTTYRQMMNKIKVLLGGRAAEEIFYGASNVSSGCAGDLQAASEIAVGMVSQYGMGETLLVTDSNDPSVLKEANKLLMDSYTAVREMLVSSKDKIGLGLKFLETNDVLSNSKLKEICDVK